ncbi:MAG TPA: acetamidase/formamidase family protein [Thermoanaerobaculia bacterium]|jgi:acetamidase/formamidase
MRTRRALGIGSLGVLLTTALLGQAAAGSADWNGEWELTTLFFGAPLAERLRLEVDKGRVSGTLRHRGKSIPITGAADPGGTIRFEYQDSDGSQNVYEGKRVADGTLSGRYTSKGGENWGEEPPSDWTARRAPSDRPAPARTLDFEPTQFSRVFSASVPPVLRIWPGDTVRTRTVDAAGVDEKGQTRVLGGNPQTGPFYVEGAMPGDVLAVHIRKLRINRATALSDDGLVDRALTNDYAADHKDNEFKNVVWRLDAERGVATLEKPPARLKDLAVPLRPMLGCVGVAPGFGAAAIRTGDSGGFGGNMDFSGIREGATVYLRASQPGALLYVGDGHALQGDGELNGNALETSLDVEFSVDLIREKSLAGPRIEDSESLMTIGLEGSLDEAFREATSALADWLQQDYGLTGPETAILLGATIEYRIAEVADRNVGVVARIRKDRIPPAPPASVTPTPTPPGKKR